MNVLHATSRLRRLNSRGISHIILPLALIMVLAVGGTFVMVAKRNGTGVLAAVSGSRVQPGYLILYSADGYYSQAQVSNGNPSAKGVCGKLAAGGVIKLGFGQDKKPGAVPHKKLKCKPAASGTNYQIQYGDSFNGRFTNKLEATGGASTLTVQLLPGRCAIVHPGESAGSTVIAQAAISSGGKCTQGENDQDPAVTLAASMQVSPELSSDHKGIKGYVSVSVPQTDLNRSQCSGKVRLRVNDAASNASVADHEFALHFVSSSSIKKPGVYYNYCVIGYQLHSKRLQPGHTFRLAADLASSNYLNAKTAEGSFTMPSVAKARTANAGWLENHYWIVQQPYLSNYIARNPVMANRLFNNSHTIVVLGGVADDASPRGSVPAGWASSGAMLYTSLDKFRADLQNGSYKNIRYAIYDAEGATSWRATPRSEVSSPDQAAAQFASLAHSHGLTYIGAPDGATNCSALFKAAARYADMIDLQVQQQENNTALYKAEVSRAKACIASTGRNVPVFAQTTTRARFDTNPTQIAQNLKDLAPQVQGYWPFVYYPEGQASFNRGYAFFDKLGSLNN